MKEYAHRWYLIGLSEKKNELQTFALDRIISFELADLPYKESNWQNSQHILKHIIGISMFELEPEEIILSFSPNQGKYLKNQPIHESQQIVKDTDKELRIQLCLV